MTSGKSRSNQLAVTSCTRWLQPTLNGLGVVFPPISLSPEIDRYLRAEEKRRVTGKMLDGCVGFLRQFVDEPPKKETLRKLTDEYLRLKVPTRIFNEAYQLVFKRLRGRPIIRK